MWETLGAGMWTTLTALWFWIVLTVGALLVGLTVEIGTRNHTSLWAVIGRSLLTMLVVPAVFYGIQRMVEAPERAAQTQRDQNIERVLPDLAAYVGNRDLVEEFIKLKAQKLFSMSTGDAERVTQDLVARLPEMKAHYKALQDESAREAMRLRLEWEPFLRAFLQQFDELVDAIQSRGIDMTTTPVDGSVFMGEVLLVQPGPRQQLIVRYVQPTGGYELRVRVDIGQVEFGKLTSYPAIYLFSREGEINRHLMKIDFHPSYITWNFGVGGDNHTGS